MLDWLTLIDSQQKDYEDDFEDEDMQSIKEEEEGI